MDDRGRIYYHQFLTSAEHIQNQLGYELNCAMKECSDRECCRESIELYSRFKHLINDINQTSITRNILRSLLESIYLMKFNINRYDRYDELELLKNKKKTKRCLKQKELINNKLNKTIPKLKSNMITIERKRYLEGLTSILLPHDMENIIISFCI